MTNVSTDRATHPFPLGMLIVLWLVGWTLRVTILAAPPLATYIADSFELGEAGVGSLTMLPVLAVAFGAIPAALIIARFGLKATIVGGILVMVIFSTLRGHVPTTSLLFLTSVVMGFGVAVFQTALPAATRVWTPTHIALGNAVFLNGMMVGELSGAGLTLPLVMPLAGGDWRVALWLWAIPIVLIAFVTAFVRLPPIGDELEQGSENNVTPQTALPSWNDARVWQYGLLFAGSIVAFFVINAFVGTILRSREELDALSGLLFFFNATPLLASFMVLARPKWIGARAPIAISALLSIVGLAGFTFLTGWPSWIAAFIAGLAATIELILLASLPATIATGKAVTRLNAGITLVGYGIGFILPLIGGWLADRMDWIEMALIPSLVFCVVVLPALGRTKRYPQYS